MNHDTPPQESDPSDQLPILYPGERLSDAEIEYVTRRYRIEVVVAPHGQAAAHLPSPAHRMAASPTQAEYAAVGRIAESLTPSDRIFTEQYGYPFDTANTPEAPGGVGGKRDAVNDAVKQYALDTFTYAIKLAGLNGVQAQYADLSQFEARELEAAAGKPLAELQKGDEADRRLSGALNLQRDRAAGRKVINHALRGFPGADIAATTPLADDEKSRLVMLYGPDHADGLSQALHELGVDFTLTEVPTSPPEERLMEQARYLAGSAALQALAELQKDE